MEKLLNDLDEIVDFVITNSHYTDREKIKEVIRKHFEYRTCLIIYDDNNGLCAVCRWNISFNGRMADIEDLIIREDFRNRNLIKRILLRGLRMYPTVKFLRWERRSKYPDREKKIYSVRELLK